MLWRTTELLRDAVSKASLLNRDIEAKEAVDTMMRPMAVKGVKTRMHLYKTESFGPTVSMIVIETEEEALRIANDIEHGLGPAIFTEDLRRSLGFAKAIESDAVHINGTSIHDEYGLLHEGMKASGCGRFDL